MTRQQICDTLMQYRNNVAKVAHYKARIAGLQVKLQRARDRMIQECQTLTPQLTGMPHAPGVSDKTADLAIKIADGWQTQQVQSIRKELQQAQAAIQQTQVYIEYAQAWLLCLTERQSYVIKHKTMRGDYNRDIIKGMQERFGETYSRQGIRKIEVTAIQAIQDMTAL